MTNLTQLSDRDRLELLYARSRHSEADDWGNVRARLAMLWSAGVRALFEEPELQIWRTSEGNGQTIWHARDPRTGQTIRRSSEAEIAVWLEERYHS